ncbi:MAG TPA: LacI family DNA-binding transcriptional regulator [Microbacterium sp.]|nr:LacI family DNA-binding transcriptional regulator [Microbacterium sp.]
MSETGISRREATVSDVARVARVSKATAARALGDYGAVSDAVRDRVQKAADELGYRPNALARTMSTGRSHTLGIVIGDIENPFFAKATRGAADVAAAAGYDLILSNSDEELSTEAKAVAVQLAKQVDGLLMAPASSLAPGNLQPVIDAGRPLVLFDRTVPGVAVDAVITDNRSGARRLTELLLRAGHRRIAFVSTIAHEGEFEAGTVLSSSAVADRVTGFVETLAEAGIAEPESWVHLNARRDGVDVLVSRLLDGEHPVTAVIASDSLIALAAFRAARERGVSIPRQLSLVGFDDADWMSLTTPGITVVEQPIHEIGAQATRLLLRRISGDRRPTATTVLEQRLVERGSVAPPAP